MATIPDALPKEYVQRAGPAAGQRARPWAGPSSSAAWRGTRAGVAEALRRASSTRRRQRPRSARCIAPIGHDGGLLACKLQYPDMQSAVEADLSQLRLIFSIYERYDRAISPRRSMPRSPPACARSSTTSARPATWRSTALMLRTRPTSMCRRSMPELSTRRLLTMSWLEGEPLLPFIARPIASWRCATRSRYNMFRAWYVPFYFYGVIHGDPHLGNYTVRPDGSINLLDFGCVRVFHARFVEGRDRPLSRAAERRPRARRPRLRILGLQGPVKRETIDVLNRWAHFVYAPLLEDRDAPHPGDASGIYGREVAEGVHHELRRLGPSSRRANSSSWTAPPSASARCSCT